MYRLQLSFGIGDRFWVLWRDELRRAEQDEHAALLTNGTSVLRKDQPYVLADRYDWRSVLKVMILFGLERAVAGAPVLVCARRDEADLSYGPYILGWHQRRWALQRRGLCAAATALETRGPAPLASRRVWATQRRRVHSGLRVSLGDVPGANSAASTL